MSDLRKERERVARRWQRITTFATALLVAALAVYLLFKDATRSCSRSGFGITPGWWGNPHCSLSETWNWVLAGADWEFWLFGIVLVTAIVVALLRNRH